MDGFIINDFLRKHQEAGIEEVENMKRHPLSLQEAEAQIKRNHSLSETRKKEARDSSQTGKSPVTQMSLEDFSPEEMVEGRRAGLI